MDMKATLLKKKQMKYLLINSDYIQAYSEYAFDSEEILGQLVPITKSNKSECSYTTINGIPINIPQEHLDQVTNKDIDHESNPLSDRKYIRSN